MINIEACIGSDDGQQSLSEAVAAAYEGGATTIELCRAMHQDGLTPTNQQIKEARAAFQKRPGLMVMVRPRAGDFFYTDPELAQMERDIRQAATAGADGVVFGVLQRETGRIATTQLNQLLTISHQYGLKTTFHRAFDATPNYAESLAQLIDVGVDRVLTSGIAWGATGTAVDGLPALQKLITQANSRIEIVIGGGVNRQNGPLILQALAKNGHLDALSLHAYSGINENGRVTRTAIQDFASMTHFRQ